MSKYTALRRPPRMGFQVSLAKEEQAADLNQDASREEDFSDREKEREGLKHLEQGFLWPMWRFKITSVELPDFWNESMIESLVVTFAPASRLPGSEIVMVRGHQTNYWALE